jgi:hypothetical protein
MKQFIKKIFGIDKIEEAKAKAEQLEKEAVERAAEAMREAEKARQAEELAKLSPKDRATKKGEPWVAVLDTKVNKDNVRNGFFELDWNEHFITELKKSGYGFDGDPDEEIVDRWFRDLARNMLAEEGISEPERVGAGFINVTKLAGGKASIE